MTHLNVRYRPQGAIPRDTNMTLTLQPAVDPGSLADCPETKHSLIFMPDQLTIKGLSGTVGASTIVSTGTNIRLTTTKALLDDGSGIGNPQGLDEDVFVQFSNDNTNAALLAVGIVDGSGTRLLKDSLGFDFVPVAGTVAGVANIVAKDVNNVFLPAHLTLTSQVCHVGQRLASHLTNFSWNVVAYWKNTSVGVYATAFTTASTTITNFSTDPATTTGKIDPADTLVMVLLTVFHHFGTCNGDTFSWTGAFTGSSPTVIQSTFGVDNGDIFTSIIGTPHSAAFTPGTTYTVTCKAISVSSPTVPVSLDSKVFTLA